MSGYRVDPRAVRGVTARARAQVAEVTAALRLLRSTVAQAQGALPGTETAAALAGVLADPLEVELQATADHIGSAADHLDQSVGFFDQGDQQMAADIGRYEG